MALPADATPVTVTAGPYYAEDGGPATGTVVLTADGVIVTPSGAQIMPRPVVARLDGTGSAAAAVAASSSVGYWVTWRLNNAPSTPPRRFLFPPDVATVDLDTAVTVNGSPSVGTISIPGGGLTAVQLANDPALKTAYVAVDALIYNALDHGLKADWASPTSYGANNQAALQSLVNSLSAAYVADGRPRHIYCPAGDYSVRDAGVVWKTGVSLIGAGPGLTRFHLANPVNTTNPTPLAAYTAAFHGASTSAPLVDCTFANFEVDGSAVTLPSYTTGPKALVLQYMLRGRFTNLYLHDCGATALGCDFLQDTIIDRVVATGNGRLNNGTQPGGAGIGIGIGGWGAIERTTIVNCITRGNATHGIFVELQDNTFARPRGVRILGCHAEGNTHGVSDWGADGLIVSGCTLTGNRKDGFNVSGSGVAGMAGVNGIVTGNVIDSNTLDGVLIGDTPGGYAVRGNRISRNGQHGVHLGSTTQAAGYATTELSISDNDIHLNANCGIRTDAVMTDGFIVNNRIRNNGTATAAATDLRSGVTFAAAANSPTIQGNRIWDNQAAKTQSYGWTITAAGTAGAAQVQNNNLNGNLTGAYNFAGSVSGGQWTQNAGFAPGATTSAQTTIIDGAEYINGQLRYVANTRVWTSATLTPAASAATNGTAATMSPASLQLGFAALVMARVVFAGTFGSETVTATFTATFSDNSTAVATATATTAGTQVVASGGLLSLHKDGQYIKTLAIALQSTIASSAVTATANVIATQN